MKLSKNLLAVPAALGLVVLTAPAASAHVTASASETGAGSYTVVTFSVPHGCDGSATTEVAIKLPDSVIEATPTRNPFYDVEKVTATLDEPIVAEDGDEITEKTDQIVYTAKTPLPDGQRDTFELSLQIPEDAEVGSTLAFPTIQTCEQGETAWTEVAEDGAEEPEHPAPSFVVTEATGEGHHGGAATEDEADHEEGDDAKAEPVKASADSDDSNTLGLIGAGAGIVGLVLGITALARTSRKSA